MTKRSSSSRSSSSRSSSSRSRNSGSSRGRSSSSRGSRKKQQPTLWEQLSLDQKLDILGWALLIPSVLTVLSLISAQQGKLTEWWISVLSQVFGWGMYFVPVFFGAIGLWLILRRFGDRIPTPDPEQVVGAVMLFFVLLATLHLIISYLQPQVSLYALGDAGLGGGLIGAALVDLSIKALGRAGTIATLVMLWLAVTTFMAGISPADAVRMLSERSAEARQQQPEIFQPPLPPVDPPPPQKPARKRRIIGGADAPKSARGNTKKAKTMRPPSAAPVANGEHGLDEELGSSGSQKYPMPRIADILEEGSEQHFRDDLIRSQSSIIESTLDSLKAPVKIQEVNQGPVVTQYGVEPLVIRRVTGRCESCRKRINYTENVTTRELDPAWIRCPDCNAQVQVNPDDIKKTRIKVSKIAGLADDLALALAARSLRIQAPIPGKSSVGIEVPNEEPALVSLRDLMDSDGFDNLKGRLRLGLGQDVSGQAVAADLRRMPHLLIAGATGAGKSVCVNSVIAAMLLQNGPDTLRMLMVDPKRVELTQYNGIPHLLGPVIVDVDQVVPMLRKVMREMDSRYRNFAKIGARNIEDYNSRVAKMEDQDPIPYIVVLIDELADMMMQAPEETERVICRLAQMSRATGIHLIIATQRPSVDVVTGLIKANFPARIAFAVASSIDSRVILDMPGAERLLGQGDMLFMPPEVSQPLRLQGAFVSEGELERLVSFWRKSVTPGKAHPKDNMAEAFTPPATAPQATQSILPNFDDEFETGAQFEDELLPTAVETFLAENRASVSLLQRRLRIGYTRSARLVDNLTDMGIVMLETEGQSRKINRAVAEALLRSLRVEEEDDGVF